MQEPSPPLWAAPSPPSSSSSNNDGALHMMAGNNSQRGLLVEACKEQAPEESTAAADDDNDDQQEAEPHVDQQPRFTRQDEERELASLTIDDIFKIQADLLGVETITGGLSGLGIMGNASASNGTDAPVNRTKTCKTYISPKNRELLMALEQELANPNIPPAQLSAYRQATVRCPVEVRDWKKLAFVEHEGGNIPAAARRLIKYWNFRLELFGDDRCFLPMTLLGAMQDEMMNIAERLVWQLLPNTDAAGRGILHCKVANRNLSQYTMKEEFRAFFYFAHCLMEDDRTRRKGFVQMVDGRHIVRQHFTRKFPKYIESFDKSFPIQMRAVHICYPSNVLFYIIHPVLHRLAPKNIRLRVKMHHGSTPDVLRSLMEYSLPSDKIHADLGGGVHADMNQFLMNRMQIEAAALGLQFPTASVGEPTTSLAVAESVRDNYVGRESKRQKSVSPPSPSAPPPISYDMATVVSGTDSSAQLSNIGSKSGPSTSSGKPQGYKRKGARNVVDPRMARAVQFKRDNPDCPLIDALEAGGFIFVTKAGQKPTDSTRIDQQGVSLKQRKNNLCRRLRIEKNKKEMKRKGGEEQSAQAMDPLNNDDLSLGDISDFEVPLHESIFDSGP